jgi:hypothetical protein
MNNWQTDWWKALDELADGVEQACLDLSNDLNDVADSLMDASEQLATQLEQTIAPHLDEWEQAIAPHLQVLDQQMLQWLDPILQAFEDVDQQWMDAAHPVNQTIEPLINRHPACVGCQHYHGQVYGETMLVCGMHPYGWDGDECPDWESAWQVPPPHG